MNPEDKKEYWIYKAPDFIGVYERIAVDEVKLRFAKSKDSDFMSRYIGMTYKLDNTFITPDRYKKQKGLMLIS